MENPVDTIFVIGGSKDVRDEELATSGYDDRIVMEVCMLEENPTVFFVNANCVLYGRAGTCAIDKGSVL